MASQEKRSKKGRFENKFDNFHPSRDRPKILNSPEPPSLSNVKTSLQSLQVVKWPILSPPLESTVAGLLGVIDIMEVRDFQLSVMIVMC